MSENDQNPEDVQDNDIEEGEDVDTGADDVEDDKGEEGKDDKKPDPKENRKETPQERVARLDRQLKRARKDAGLTDNDTQTKPGKIDLAAKAYLAANGIKGADEVKLVETFMKNTGKSLDDVVESKYFQGELKDHRESKAATDATPKGTKRSGQTAKDSVEFWIAKGQLPPADQVELRRKVVNAKMKAAQNTNVFTDHPVIGG